MKMNTLTYVLIAVLNFSGLLFGIILAYLAKEEIAFGKKYFMIFQEGIMICVVFIAMLSVNIPTLFSAMIAAAFFFLVYAYSIFRMSLISYSILGLLLFLSSFQQDYLLINSCLIFIFGLAQAAIVFPIKQKIQTPTSYYVYLMLGFFLFSLAPFFFYTMLL